MFSYICFHLFLQLDYNAAWKIEHRKKGEEKNVNDISDPAAVNNENDQRKGV